MNRVAILTVSVGQGHQQVSTALQSEWEKRGYEVEIIDVLYYMKKQASVPMKTAYFYCIRSLPPLWDWTYRFTDNHIAVLVLQPLWRLLWKSLAVYCEKKMFDVMIGTHPLATQLCLWIKKRGMVKGKFFAVLTDFETHRLSISRKLDAIFVAREAERMELQQKYPNCSFYAFGIPLKKEWDFVECNREKIRKRLSLPIGRKVIIVSGGGEGLLQEETVISILEQDREPAYVCWFLGKGQGDAKKRDNVFLKNGTRVHYLPFSSNYPDYIKACDFFISKPGGVSMAEALHWNIPTGVISSLPGQEKINESILMKYRNITKLDRNRTVSDILSGMERNSRNLTETLPSRTRIVDKMLQTGDTQILSKRIFPFSAKEWN
ncbi:MGDG synthase family glycosyltransferase [Evansella tamaricis]|uniref:Uncharacterized protein n=1 Tax=Evansella tamaricis TaxID=2069301 RepID=A0ABS6J992_9BACI|nr:glycosyltransferase [Evansella tamaricis]MBU9710251.1 hypothetical protein [Evansella tamaricis]